MRVRVLPSQAEAPTSWWRGRLSRHWSLAAKPFGRRPAVRAAGPRRAFLAFGEFLAVSGRLGPCRVRGRLALLGRLHRGLVDVLPQGLVLRAQVDRLEVLRRSTEDLAGRRVVEVLVHRGGERRVVERLDVARQRALLLELGELALLAGQVLQQR